MQPLYTQTSFRSRQRSCRPAYTEDGHGFVIEVFEGNSCLVPEWHGPYALNALPGLTQTGSEETLAYFPQPMAKKSPTGTSTEGSFSSSQYLRRIENRQFPVGVIQMCSIAPEPVISATV